MLRIRAWIGAERPYRCVRQPRVRPVHFSFFIASRPSSPSRPPAQDKPKERTLLLPSFTASFPFSSFLLFSGNDDQLNRHQYAVSIQFSTIFTHFFFTIIFLYARHNEDAYTHCLPALLFHATGLDYLEGTQMYLLSSLLARRGCIVNLSMCSFLPLFAPSRAFSTSPPLSTRVRGTDVHNLPLISDSDVGRTCPLSPCPSHILSLSSLKALLFVCFS